MTFYQRSLGIGATIRQLRIRNEMTPTDVAVKLQMRGLDISPDKYRKIERDCRGFSIDTLVALKSIFKVEYGEFFVDLP